VDGAHKRLSELDQGAPTPHGCACVCQYMSVCMCARKGCVGSTRVHTHAPGYEYHTYPKQQPGYESQHFIGHVCIATVCRTSSQATRHSILLNMCVLQPCAEPAARLRAQHFIEPVCIATVCRTSSQATRHSGNSSKAAPTGPLPLMFLRWVYACVFVSVSVGVDVGVGVHEYG